MPYGPESKCLQSLPIVQKCHLLLPLCRCLGSHRRSCQRGRFDDWYAQPPLLAWSTCVLVVRGTCLEQVVSMVSSLITFQIQKLKEHSEDAGVGGGSDNLHIMVSKRLDIQLDVEHP